jgi:type I restriction enzyme S subunit
MNNSDPSLNDLVPLSQYVHFQEGPGIRKSQNVKDGIRYLNIRCFVDGRLDKSSMHMVAESEAFGKYKHFLLDAGDYVVSSSGTLGRLVEVFEEDLPIMLNTSTIRFKPKDESRLDRIFLKYFLISESFQSQVKNLATGSVQLNYGPSHLEQVKIPSVPIEKQRGIVSIIEPIDAKIAHNKSLSRTLESVAQSLFRSWFVDFDPVKSRIGGQRSPDMDTAISDLFSDDMVDSELGPIPKGWEITELFDCGLDIESGSRPKGGVKGITEGVPSIGAESINGIGVFDYSKTKFVPEEFFEKMRKGIPEDFDVLLYKDGGKPGEFKPRVGMFGVGFPYPKFAINEHVFLLRSDVLGQPFIYFWMKMERTLDVLRNRGIKAAIPGINQKDVGTLLVLKPPTELVMRFNQICLPYLQMILNLSSESVELTRLRDSLLPRLISGELEIPQEMLVS